MNRPLYVDVEHRSEIGEWLNRHEYTGQFAEIGCLSGQFAREVLHHWKGYRYWMIDPWRAQPSDVYRERTEGTDYEACYHECCQLAEQDKRVRLIRKMSVDAAKDFEDASLEIVHIDGNHAYGPVLADMDAWWPKLKSGGIFSGDDYGNDTNWPNWAEVKHAVDRWMAERRLTFVVDRRPAWWCIKP